MTHHDAICNAAHHRPDLRIAIKTAAALILLTALSCFIILRNANNEPYTSFQWADAIEQVGVGYALALTWTYFLYAIVRNIVSDKLSTLWLITAPLILLLLFFVLFAANGYFEDLSRFAN